MTQPANFRRVMNLNSDSRLTRELAGADRAILLIVFLAQTYISLSLFWAAAMVSKLVNVPPYGLFGLWGLVSACGLFFTGVLPRLFALSWHVAFFGYLFLHLAKPENALRTSNANLWVLYGSLATLYLALTAILRYRMNKKIAEVRLPKHDPDLSSNNRPDRESELE